MHCGQMVGLIKMKLGTQVGLISGHTVLDGDPAPLPQRGTGQPIFGPYCCGQMAAWIKMSLDMELGLSPSDFVLDGDLAPLPKRGRGAQPPPQFPAHFYCGQTAGCIKMPLGMDVGLSPEDLLLDEEPVPLPDKGAEPPKFSAHVYCGQTAGWIKMPLGMEVGLGLRDIVFDVDPATPRKKGHSHSHPIFGPCVLWPNGWMDEYAAWYGSRPRLRPHCTRRVPAPAKGAQQPHYFQSMSIVATFAHLSYC